MSWGSTPIKPADAAHINEAIDEAGIVGMESDEHREQLAAAKEAAKALIASGVLGDGADGRLFIVRMNGHANPGHQPTPGWANDAVSVSVSSEPADSDPVKWANEAYARHQEQVKLLEDVQVKG